MLALGLEGGWERFEDKKFSDLYRSVDHSAVADNPAVGSRQ